jgi:hypothetical protein
MRTNRAGSAGLDRSFHVSGGSVSAAVHVVGIWRSSRPAGPRSKASLRCAHGRVLLGNARPVYLRTYYSTEVA